MVEKKGRDRYFAEAWKRARERRREVLLSDLEGEVGELVSLSDEEVEAGYKAVKAKFERVCDLIEKNYEALGTNRDEGRSFLGNPDNFTSEQLRMMERERKRLDQELFKERAEQYSKALVRGEVKKQAKKRRRKMLGSRKKGWIPMR